MKDKRERQEEKGIPRKVFHQKNDGTGRFHIICRYNEIDFGQRRIEVCRDNTQLVIGTRRKFENDLIFSTLTNDMFILFFQQINHKLFLQPAYVVLVYQTDKMKIISFCSTNSTANIARITLIIILKKKSKQSGTNHLTKIV